MIDQPQRKIIHCDCDCFFAAVEMRDNPALRDIPLAIGGSSDRRGVLSTCNYQARKFGIHSAMATAHAMKLCPNLTVIPGSMDKYREASAAIMAIYAEYTDLIEPLSLDEAYLDVSGVSVFGGSATLIAEDIRRRVSEAVGITISAGVAPNKFIAKIASDWNKPDGLCVITPDKVDAFILQLPVKKIFGVGKVTSGKLQQMGIETCADLRQLSMAKLVNRFGRFGKRLYELSRGEDDRPVKVSRERKSISVEHTFASDLPDLQSCISQLPAMLEELEQRFQRHSKQREVAGGVLKLKFSDFTQTTVEQSGSECPLMLYEHLCREAWLRGGKTVRLIGLGYRLKPRNPQSAEQLKLID
ncbi:DNA polymerase IV [Amphritea japonica]|uniref:DNA polymerase IV n=1 Tax=Amphritea japonica ATCC BAA-1530 TaxID=1278309 RepID=A0A7R6SSV1_9GAMM|nr:DNA polymerase IV [Amphritea japonica ATCC BAA-1530]